MTGFASLAGQLGRRRWEWEARSVNGRGLDIRIRLPESCEFLEPAIRREIGKCCVRGRLSVALRLTRNGSSAEVVLNGPALKDALESARQVMDAAQAAGVPLSPDTPTGILSLPGVRSTDNEDDAGLTAWHDVLKTELPVLVAALDDARLAEGRMLVDVLFGHLDQVETFLDEVAALVPAARERSAKQLHDAVEKLLGTGVDLDEGRIATELAMLAVRSDVSEEQDRLRGHLSAARELLATGGPIGRKFDFLLQEFNREASTLCSKAATSELNAVGLELKVVIDRMREQVQNVE